MNEKATGYIIKTTDSGENDEIIHFYTADYGQLSFYAKGIKKISSKNAYACQLFDYSEFLFDYNDNRDMQLLKSATLKKEYMGIKSDYERLALGSVVLEIISSLNDEGFFDLLQTTLELLDREEEIYTVFSIFVVEVLNELGISPEVDSCVCCGDTTSIETISISDGGFLCHDCNRSTNLRPVTIEGLRSFRVINKASFAVFNKATGLGLNSYDLASKLIEFLIMHSGINLRSWRSVQGLHQ